MTHKSTSLAYHLSRTVYGAVYPIVPQGVLVFCSQICLDNPKSAHLTISILVKETLEDVSITG